MMVGDKVLTMMSDRRTENWTPEAEKTRRFGVFGEIVAYSKAFETYSVKHLDWGNVSFYEECELELAGDGTHLACFRALPEEVQKKAMQCLFHAIRGRAHQASPNLMTIRSIMYDAGWPIGTVGRPASGKIPATEG